MSDHTYLSIFHEIINDMTLMNILAETSPLTNPMTVEYNYIGFFIIFFMNKFYAVSHTLGRVPVADIQEETWKVWHDTQRCFVSDSLGDLKHLVDNSQQGHFKLVMNEIGEVIRTGDESYVGELQDSIYMVLGELLRRAPATQKIHFIMDKVDLLAEHGETLFKDEKHNEAFNTFTAILDRVNKVRGVLLNNLAVLNIHNGKYGIAEMQLISAIENSPGSFLDAQKNLEMVRVLMGGPAMEPQRCQS